MTCDMWAPYVTALSDNGWTVLAYDMWGHGHQCVCVCVCVCVCMYVCTYCVLIKPTHYFCHVNTWGKVKNKKITSRERPTKVSPLERLVKAYFF
jgi:hypothetical protein